MGLTAGSQVHLCFPRLFRPSPLLGPRAFFSVPPGQPYPCRPTCLKVTHKMVGEPYSRLARVYGVSLCMTCGRTREDRSGDRAEAFTLLNMAVFLMAWTSSGASGGSRYLSLVSSQFCLYKTWTERTEDLGLMSPARA